MASKLQYHYKLRSECYSDILWFLRRLSVVCIKENHQILSFSIEKLGQFPDCTMEFTTTLSLERIHKILVQVRDGHVMLETVNHFTVYTGDRELWALEDVFG